MTSTATTSPTEDDVFPEGWTDLDTKAVDTVRVLAADAVQKVGNGHPGTAISLAPVAYLLFQKVMRHNPAEPHWPGRDRFVLSCGHSSICALPPALPRRLGPRARRHRGAAHLGLQDPGPPRVRPHRRCRDHHRPARPGHRQRGGHGHGRPPRARPARPRRPRGRVDLRPPHLLPGLRRRHRGGHQQRGVLARRHPAARQPHADLRPQLHLDRGSHRHRADRGHRAPATRRTAGTCDRRLARGRRVQGERQGPARRDRGGPEASPTGPPSSSCARSSRGPRPPSRTPRARTAARSARTRWPRSRRCSASTRSKSFDVDDEVLAHTRELRDRGAGRPGRVAEGLRHLGRDPPRREGPLRPAWSPTS